MPPSVTTGVLLRPDIFRSWCPCSEGFNVRTVAFAWPRVKAASWSLGGKLDDPLFDHLRIRSRTWYFPVELSWVCNLLCTLTKSNGEGLINFLSSLSEGLGP